MAENEITFNNQADIKVQLQLFTGYELAGTCVALPGESGRLPAEQERYDIYLKNGATGWEIGHKLNCQAKSLTLTRLNGRYVIT